MIWHEDEMYPDPELLSNLQNDKLTKNNNDNKICNMT